MFELLLAIATWRITYFLCFEDAPYRTMDRIRDWSSQYEIAPLFCFNCTSVWVGFAMSLMTDNWLLYGLVFSSFAIILNAVVSSIEK